ncbi:hypothetical protein M997_0690 [Proteus hauseri ATCC 700826]|uniref:Uncharacterized protein n=1 Tax=Proteus hauseri ATCC 700826 TaxID=1354271 RepID=A0AAJ3HVQ6_PROHU|nr:hypothetical protein [Proteus hauseri]OAT49474.1 hypothetical protein M997_0690 [Proteus hauseri ATCC 700826]
MGKYHREYIVINRRPIIGILIKASGDSYDSVFIFMMVALAASAIVM